MSSKFGLEKKKDIPKWIAEISDIMLASDFCDFENHEAIHGYLVQPEWVDKLEILYGDSWRSFPQKPADLKPRSLGLKIGKELGGNIRGAEFALKNRDLTIRIIEKWINWIEPGSEGVEIEMDGVLEGWDEDTSKAADSAKIQMLTIIGIVLEEGFEITCDFMAGLSSGISSSKKVNPLKFDESDRVTIARVLREKWESVGPLSNLREVADLVLEGMPTSRRDFIESNKTARKAFDDNLRKMCRSVGLKKARRGRPKK